MPRGRIRARNRVRPTLVLEELILSLRDLLDVGIELRRQFHDCLVPLQVLIFRPGSAVLERN